MYKGVIIEESLSDKSLLQRLQIVAQEVEKVTPRHETPWLEEWTLDTVEVPETNIEAVAQNLSKVIDVSHCGNWYCDFKNADWHYVVFCKKVFKLNRKNPADYAAMQEYAESLGLPKHQMPSYSGADTVMLAKFLIEAKKQTYANGNAAKTASSRNGSNDYRFERIIDGQKMTYHDCYFGGTRFIGEEVVYCEDKVLWGMNYYGVTLDQNLSEEAMDKALRPALMRVGEDDILPVRGPKRFVDGDYEYTFDVDGDLENFNGIEEIRKGDKLIYRLRCAGGIII